MTLDYRTPGTGSHRIQRVIGRLEQAEALGWAGVGTKLLFGIPLCLLGPLFATGIIAGLFRYWSVAPISTSLVFISACIVVMPILFWLERRTAGEYGSELIRGTSAPSSYGEFEVTSAKAWWVFWMELALIGPRLVLSAVDCMRGRTRGDPVTRATAAGILVDLLDSEQGVDLRELVRSDRPLSGVVRAVAFLQAHDWVDVSGKKDRVWLTSPARNTLNRLDQVGRGGFTDEL